ALRERGVEVVVEAVDASDEAAMAALWAQRTPVGVVHAAGVTVPQSAEHLQRGDIEAIVSGKAEGARVLASLAAARPDITLVFFSSIAATWGSRDLAAYAAANGYLDGLAGRLRELGRTAMSIAWGPWGGGGMVDAERAASLDRAGVQLLAPAEALTALGAVLVAGRANTAVARVQWRVLRPALSLHAERALLSGILGEGVRVTEAPAPERVDEAVPEAPSNESPRATPTREWSTVPLDERAEPLREHLREAIRKVMHLDASRTLSDDEPIGQLGFDSLMATELKARLRDDGLDVPLGRLLGGPSIDELVVMVLAKLRPPEVEGPAPAAVVVAPPEPEASLLVWTHLAVFVLGLAIAFGIGAWLWGP
ncbi:MAG: beta-ketoacyl reductase, partial [Myxococcota bacterium]